MNKLLFLTLLLLSFCFSARAQDFEYGKPIELKGLKKVYVNTGSDVKNRTRIVEEIEKANLGVEFVDGDEDAEIFLTFRGETNEVTSGASTQMIGNSAITNINTERLAAGAGLVAIGGKSKPRLLISVENSQQSKLEKKPSVKFAREFIKQYRIANGINDKKGSSK